MRFRQQFATGRKLRKRRPARAYLLPDDRNCGSRIARAAIPHREKMTRNSKNASWTQMQNRARSRLIIVNHPPVSPTWAEAGRFGSICRSIRAWG